MVNEIFFLIPAYEIYAGISLFDLEKRPSLYPAIGIAPPASPAQVRQRSGHSCPCKTGFRLVDSPLPGGSRTLWTAAKGFRFSTSLSPFQGLP
jgi:hypothetical protein